jgi:hypothetical protein
MLQKIQDLWKKWRESRLQAAIDRSQYRDAANDATLHRDKVPPG